MKFSYSWLKDWVQVDAAVDEFTHGLSMAGLEVDSVEAVGHKNNDIVVGRLQQIQQHPTEERLSVCQVDIGEHTIQVVTELSLNEGLVLAVATEGAELADGKIVSSVDFDGVESRGYFVSDVEMGLSEDAPKIIYLDDDAPLGMPLTDYLLLDDVSIDIELTPNRGDCLSLAGLSRDVGVIFKKPVSEPEYDNVVPSIEEACSVAIDEPDKCLTYTGRLIKGIDVKAKTPDWIKERLRRSGISTISIVVDVTNYVMIELGQPMHAFDASKLSGQVIVRCAQEKETLTLLDGKEVTLSPDELVIADEKRAIALAGIMGGQETAIDDDTQDIFLESAHFVPVQILGKARRHGLQTDSSYRFERGVDPSLSKKALERATLLIAQYAGGQVGPVTEVSAGDITGMKKQPITLRYPQISRILGIELSVEQVEETMSRLGMRLELVQPGEWQVFVPNFRFDIEQEIDLIEEVARIYGYDNISAQPIKSIKSVKLASESTKHIRDIKQALVERGYQEAITYSFIDKTLHQQVFGADSVAYELENPIASDMSVMRTSMLPGLLKALQFNVNRQQSRLRLFEVGRVFVHGAQSELAQEMMLSGISYGAICPEQWAEELRDIDFFDAKGDVEALLSASIKLNQVVFEKGSHPGLHPQQTAKIIKNGQQIGYVGVVHPRLTQAMDIPGTVAYFELLTKDALSLPVTQFEKISKFPAIRRDLAILLDEGIPSSTVLAACRETGGEWLKACHIFDVYQGKGIPDGKKSLAICFSLQHPGRTLKDTETQDIMDNVTACLLETFNAILRG